MCAPIVTRVMSGRVLIRYAMWSVFRIADRAALDGAAGRPPAGWEASAGSAVREALVAELTELPTRRQARAP